MPRTRGLPAHRIKSAAVCACAIVLAAATVWAHSPPREFTQDETPQATEARKTFETVCASCHGLDGRGGERGPDVVSRAGVAAKSDTELKEILEKGKTSAGMPAFASYGTERLSALVGYLRTLQGRGKAVVRLPGKPAQGKSLFFGKGKCGECHMVAGRGGFLGQDLTRYGGKRGVDDIRAAIVSPDKDLDPRRGQVTVVFRNSSRLTGLARNEDNFSLQLQTADGTFHLLNKADIEKLSYEGRSGMPANYGSTLSGSELNDLVSFLLHSAGTAADQAKDRDDDFDE